MWPYVDAALGDCQAHTSFVVAVGLVGDLCTALDHNVAPIVPAAMSRLLTALADPDLPSVRPPPGARGCRVRVRVTCPPYVPRLGLGL